MTRSTCCPVASASENIGRMKRGRDQNMWKSMECRNGTVRWVLAKKNAAPTKSLVTEITSLPSKKFSMGSSSVSNKRSTRTSKWKRVSDPDHRYCEQYLLSHAETFGIDAKDHVHPVVDAPNREKFRSISGTLTYTAQLDKKFAKKLLSTDPRENRRMTSTTRKRYVDNKAYHQSVVDCVNMRRGFRPTKEMLQRMNTSVAFISL